MLLRRDPDGVRPFEQVAACRRQRLPPAVRMALGPVRVRRARLGDDRPVLGAYENYLDRLRGGIDPCDQLHDGELAEFASARTTAGAGRGLGGIRSHSVRKNGFDVSNRPVVPAEPHFPRAAGAGRGGKLLSGADRTID